MQSHLISLQYSFSAMSVNTVLGEVKREDLGVTLTHEHFALNFDRFYVAPPQIYKDKFNERLTLHNVGYLRQYPYSSRQNLDFKGAELESVIVDEVKLFAAAEGRTIVENTSWGLDRNLKVMERVSRETNVNVVAGTGHYVVEVQPASVVAQRSEELYNTIKQEMCVGCFDNPSIKCGFVGEVGSSWPIHEFERRCIVAAGMAQAELKCPVSFHPGRDPEAPAEILRLYMEAGGDPSRAVMSHLDRTMPSVESTLEFSELGSYCQFDLFGTEVSFYQLCPERDMPNDGQRIDRIKALIAEKKGDKVLVSHDIHTRHRLVRYGGHGFAHIPVQVKNHMSHKGIPTDTIHRIMVENPATWLTGVTN